MDRQLKQDNIQHTDKSARLRLGAKGGVGGRDNGQKGKGNNGYEYQGYMEDEGKGRERGGG